MEATIELIANKYFKEEKKNPKEIWANQYMDALRRLECICMNCETMKSCPTAKKLYGICQEDDMALAITRCGSHDAEGNLRYQPKKK